MSQSTMLVLYESVAAATISVVGLYVERSGGEVANGATPGLWLERREDGAHWPVMAVVRHSSYVDLRVGDLFTVVLGTGAPPNVGDEVGLSTAPRPTEMVADRRDLEPTTPLSAAAKDQLNHVAGEVRHQLDAGHMPNGNDLDRLARWAQQAARYGVADADLEAKIAKQADYITEIMQRLEMSSARWTEWAAKILAAYPWVDEFKPEDSDEKYRDGVRYVLLCLECNGNGGIAYATEMQEIKAKWGFS